MANIKSNIKNIRKIKRQTLRNKFVLTNLKTVTKNVRSSKDAASLPYAYKKIDSAFAKGKIHKNKANRLKSRLALAINKAKNPAVNPSAVANEQKNS
ncbi:MAG: 30S ribosomal protein S20 [Mycoplasmataceae bacterium]|jgi:small subunit ribosomal protein S20|nr:30S ribosomal protein S20 [Mycoplasmataceae bacterium]